MLESWPAFFSLFALLLVLAAGSLLSRINAGILAIAAAYLVGFLTGTVDPAGIAKGFPDNLFLMLVGITLLFAIADKNGTLERITALFLRLARGRAALLPIIYFFLAFLLSAIGPGNIAAAALLAPSGMALAVRSGVSLLLMAILICTGANAGAFSPVAPTGIISTGLLQKIDLVDPLIPLHIFAATAGLQSITALGAVFLFSDWSTLRNPVPETATIGHPVNRPQWLTIFAIVTLIVLVLFFQLSVGPVAFVLVSVLWLIGGDRNRATLKDLPWDAIFLLTGIAILISVLEASGGLTLLVGLIADISGPHTINGVLALLTGIASAFSSSSGVIMPAFVPMIPEIMKQTGVSDPVDLAVAICAGSHMVDVSPLSTLGALCIASAPVGAEERSVLFRKLLLWGLSMALVGAALAFLFLDQPI
jgi:Na+/H+ antiporter NhaD/arsenite permease-like protein